MRKLVFILLILLMLSTAVEASTKTYNFTVENNTALNFENGSYIVEVVEITPPLYVKVDLTSDDQSVTRNLYDSEAAITYKQIKLSSSSITKTSAVITIEFPDGWSAPKKYQIARPVAPVGVPNIVLTKSVDKTSINVGDVVQIKIIAENKGNGTAYNLTLIEPLLPNGLTIAPTSRSPVIKDKLDPGEVDDQPYYGVKAVESGTFNIESTTVKYGSKTSKSNSLTITVAAAVLEKSNLTTVISIDKKNVYTNDPVKATIKITNTGKASAKSVLVEGTPQLGMEIIEGDLRQVYGSIDPMDAREYRVTLKPKEPGNYTIHLRTIYNDNMTGVPSDSETIIVAQKERNYLYILAPIIIIIAGIVLFTIKRHKEYSY
jgi:uncharacterized repeat protein (TIGR01451 family)